VQYAEIIRRLESMANPQAVEEMARFGIISRNVLGISTPEIMRLAKEISKDHTIAGELWASGIYEGRILACFVEDPSQLSERQMESWVKDFDSWAVCDQCCMRLFDKSPMAYGKVIEWSRRKEEYVRRAGFVLMAVLAVHDKKAADEKFIPFLSIIRDAATDERNYVKKAVNWALRQIGKRNIRLNQAAVETAEAIKLVNSSSARWIAADALRELRGKAVQERLHKKQEIAKS
jgi:3-methyladenine DNA glycosylase AlkD